MVDGDSERVIGLERVEDARGWAALRSAGLNRSVLGLRLDLEDVEGAVAAGQLGVAASQARAVLLDCLSIRSLAAGGELDGDRDDVAFDPFYGVAVDEVEHALALVRRGIDLACGSDADAEAWVEAVTAHVRDMERLLGYRSLPDVHSPDGLFPALRLARRWQPVIAAWQLPGLLPTEYVE